MLIVSKSNGDTLSASEFNQVTTELQSNLITTSGQTPASGTLDQVGIAVASYAGQGGVFCTDSGAANSYVLTQVSPFKAPYSLKEGLTLRYRPANNNTGASTVNAFGLGVKNIKQSDGTTDPTAGMISTAYDIVIRYDGTSFRITDDINGQFRSVQVFTASGTWTKPAGISRVFVEVIGAGGQGGSVSGANPSSGGGGGGYSAKWITSSLGATETVTVGAGGSGAGIGVNGNNGGTSSFGAHCSATGGTGGSSDVGIATGGGSGVGSGGDVNLKGGEGGTGVSITSNGFGSCAPRGGGVAQGSFGTGVGGAGIQYGGGGGGGGTTGAGGVGAAGIVIVYEYS